MRTMRTKASPSMRKKAMGKRKIEAPRAVHPLGTTAQVTAGTKKTIPIASPLRHRPQHSPYRL